MQKIEYTPLTPRPAVYHTEAGQWREESREAREGRSKIISQRRVTSVSWHRAGILWPSPAMVAEVLCLASTDLRSKARRGK